MSPKQYFFRLGSLGLIYFAVSACGGGGGGSGSSPMPVSLPTISINDRAIEEGDAGTTPVELTVSLSKASSMDISVAWVTEEGTSVAGRDFVDANGVLTIPAGETDAILNLEIVGDNEYSDNDPTSSFSVVLSSPSNATISDGTGTITITNDDLTKAEAFDQLWTLVNEYVDDSSQAYTSFFFDISVIEVDLENDGDKDFTISSNDLNLFSGSTNTLTPMAIFRNQLGDGFVREVTTITLNARDWVVSDFNGDGFEDIFLASFGPDSPPFPGERDRFFVQDVLTGTLVDRSDDLPNIAATSHGICTGDFDSDGDTDINVSTGGRQIMLSNSSAGEFTDTSALNLPMERLSWEVLLEVGGPFIPSLAEMGFFWCAAGDVDADNDIDIILGETNTATGTDSDLNLIGKSHVILFNDGAGRFDYQFPTSLIANPNIGDVYGTIDGTVEMVLRDWNGDNCTDLATISTDYYNEQQVNIFRGDCTGGYAPSQTFTYAVGFDADNTWTQNLDAIDVNDDGFIDLVTSYKFTEKLRAATSKNADRVYVNDQNGGFTERMVTNDDLFLGSPGWYLKLRKE